MSQRIAYEPYTIERHQKLTEKLNKMAMAIKIHHTIAVPTNEQEKANIEKAKSNCMMPTWDNVVSLLMGAIQELQQDRINPVKY